MALNGSRFARTTADLNWEYLDSLINDLDGQTSGVLRKERRKLAERVEALKHGLDAAITSTRIQVYKLDDGSKRRTLQRGIDFLESLRRGSVRVRTRAVLGSRSGKKGKKSDPTPATERRSSTGKSSSDSSPKKSSIARHTIPDRSPTMKRTASSVDGSSACVTPSSEYSNDGSSYRGDLILRIPKSRITSGIFGFESGDFGGIQLKPTTPIGKKSRTSKRVRNYSSSSVFDEPEPQKRERPPGVYQLRRVVSSGHVCTKCLGCNGHH
ncbi:uncharacterized protein LOC118412110 [Branchiostoma floridae]|uniref:Uncharacterized protein LOC118412110 n=1 Tax=Branchiostoma floridae TaxID=7739 RepID=C3YDM4_BRAFL|nr:uncharacterized protein LOC118412110 [Branchiostoma floridae]|eukprot:XP_002605483.1 hypothetical protein BRAFLDRAFT_126795 [Branchiostoma floridae]